MRKISKLICGVCLAIGLVIAFTGCSTLSAVMGQSASGGEKPPVLGQTLEETLGTSVDVLVGMLGKTQKELESLFGRKLLPPDQYHEGYLVIDYPKTGLGTTFMLDNKKVVTSLAIRYDGQKAVTTLTQQMDEKFNAHDMVKAEDNTTAYFWLIKPYVTVTVPTSPFPDGAVFWFLNIFEEE